MRRKTKHPLTLYNRLLPEPNSERWLLHTSGLFPFFPLCLSPHSGLEMHNCQWLLEVRLEQWDQMVLPGGFPVAGEWPSCPLIYLIQLFYEQFLHLPKQVIVVEPLITKPILVSVCMCVCVLGVCVLPSVPPSLCWCYSICVAYFCGDGIEFWC